MDGGSSGKLTLGNAPLDLVKNRKLSICDPNEWGENMNLDRHRLRNATELHTHGYTHGEA